MTITKDEALEIKKQLLTQVEQMPSEEKERIKKYIEGLDETQLEEFLKQNKIDYKSGDSGGPSVKPQKSDAPECIFCSIIKGEMPSYKILESKKAIVILEINPLSKGHSIVVPIRHTSIENIPKASLTLAQKIAKKIKKKFHPEDIKIETTSFGGHAMINIIPIYKDTPLQKKKGDEKELKEIQKKLGIHKRKKRKAEDNETLTEKIVDKSGKIIEVKKEKPISKLPKISFRVP